MYVYSNMTGLEYILLHVQDPILYVVRKQHRASPSQVQPISDYYIIAGVIYQAPDLNSIINSRIVSTIAVLFNNIYWKINLIVKRFYLIKSYTLSFVLKYYVQNCCNTTTWSSIFQGWRGIHIQINILSFKATFAWLKTFACSKFLFTFGVLVSLSKTLTTTFVNPQRTPFRWYSIFLSLQHPLLPDILLHSH